jgi:hypothetical protein
MFKKSLVVTLVAVMAACFAGTAFADIVSPDSSYCVVSLGTSGKDRVTISPNGTGDNFTDVPSNLSITIEVYLRNSLGAPLAGVPLQEITLYNSALCICAGGNTADAATDLDGRTTFTASPRAGGCVESLDIFADGVFLCTTPVKTNSWDAVPATPCNVDAADLSALAARLGNAGQYSICFDYNESGPPTINAGDLSSFAAHLANACQ